MHVCYFDNKMFNKMRKDCLFFNSENGFKNHSHFISSNLLGCTYCLSFLCESGTLNYILQSLNADSQIDR